MEFNLNDAALEAIKNVFQDRYGRPMSPQEIQDIEAILNKPSDYDSEPIYSPKTEHLLYKQSMEQIAYKIRFIVVTYVDCLDNPYPYFLKKNLPMLKEYHAEVLSAYHHDFSMYNDAVKYAFHDSFEGDMRILDQQEACRDLFMAYTAHPDKLNLQNIKTFVKERYLSDIDDSLFLL